ncbi:MAG: hypothetical protein QOF38_527, partial [Pseudonocardiales bacterium]|nr:hypothetical protein [Pseudonocardiales bacterium]
MTSVATSPETLARVRTVAAALLPE